MVYIDIVYCAPLACLVSLNFFILLHFSELLIDYTNFFLSKWNAFLNEVAEAASWVIMNVLELNTQTIVLIRGKILFLFLFWLFMCPCPCPGTAQEWCWGCLCEVALGLFYYGQTWFQLAPANASQGTAEPLRDIDCTSTITCLRKREKCCRAGVREEWEKWERETPGSVKQEGEEVLQAPRQRFSWSPWWRPW